MSLIPNYEEFQNICRTCLFIGKLRPIVDSVVIEIIRGISGIEVKSDPEFPQNICETCYKRIYKINEFAVQCKRNEQTLHNCRSEYFQNFSINQDEIPVLESMVIKEEIVFEDEMMKIKDEIKEENTSDPIEFKNVEQPPETKHKCLKCNKIFTRFGEFKRHMHAHKKQFPYTYKVCNKPIRHKLILNRQRLFQRTRRAQCNLCLKIFYDFDALKVHLRTHLAKPEAFVCNVCRKEFSTQDFLQRHYDGEHATLNEDSEVKTSQNEILVHVDPRNLLVDEESSDPLCVEARVDPAQTNNYLDGFNGKRLRDRNFCMFCKTTVLNFVRHITRHHLKEPEVKRVLASPVGSRERKQQLSLLRKKGNYMINSIECTKPVKKSKKATKTAFLPCVSCLGFYTPSQLWKHRKVCIANSSQTQRGLRPCAEAQNLLVRHLNIDQTLRDVVFPRMRPDHISLVAKNDALICAYGARYMHVHDNDSKKHIVNVTSRKMRELAKLLVELKHLEPAINTLWQALHPQYFDRVVAAVKTVAKYDETTKIYESPTYALQMATTLKHCCDIILNHEDVFHSNPEDVRCFISLLESNWKLVVVVQPPVSVPVPVKDEHYFAHHLDATEDVDSTPKVGNKRVLVPWTSEQKKVVHVFFKEHITHKRAPKKTECEALIQQHPVLLHNKNWLKIKVYVQNKYTK